MAKRTQIEVFQGQDTKWYFHRKSSNGKITSPSQGYANNSNAHRAAKKLFPGVLIVTLAKEK